MRTCNRKVVAVLVASSLAAAPGWPGVASAQTAAPASVSVGTVAAAATGTVTPAVKGAAAASAAHEPVAFSGQVAISGRVVNDTTFGAPPVLEIIVDLSSVTGKGARTGKAYTVQSQAILHRPLQPFDQIEVGFSYAPDGDVLQARSGLATFGVYYSAGKGITTTPVRIVPHPRT